MASSKTPQLTDFTQDILGRYMCNGLDEAMHSTDKAAQRPDGSPQSDARPFNAIIIGGGSSGGWLARPLCPPTKPTRSRPRARGGGGAPVPDPLQLLPLRPQPTEGWGVA